MLHVILHVIQVCTGSRTIIRHNQAADVHRRRTYITEDFVGLAGTDGVLLFRVASPLVQVGAVKNITQHVLAPLSYLVSDDVGWDVDFGFGLIVVLLVDPLFRHTR